MHRPSPCSCCSGSSTGSASSSGRPAQAILQLPVDHRALRRLHQGHHRHQAPGLLPELHHVRPVPDRQVGRQRTVARLIMVKRILGLLGWLGVVFVFVGGGHLAASARSGRGSAAWRSPASSARCSTSSASGVNRPRVLRAAGALRHRWPAASVLVVLGDSRRRSTTSADAPQQALGPDGEPASSRCRIRPRRCCRG